MITPLADTLTHLSSSQSIGLAAAVATLAVLVFGWGALERDLPIGCTMPTFYFGLWDGHQIEPDEQGVELRGTEDAFEMAVRGARELLAEALLTGGDRSG